MNGLMPTYVSAKHVELGCHRRLLPTGMALDNSFCAVCCLLVLLVTLAHLTTRLRYHMLAITHQELLGKTPLQGLVTASSDLTVDKNCLCYARCKKAWLSPDEAIWLQHSMRISRFSTKDRHE